MVGCYLALYGDSTLESVAAAIGHSPIDAEILVAINFNIELEFPDDNEHNEAIAAAVETEGLEYTTQNFLPRKLLWILDGLT